LHVAWRAENYGALRQSWVRYFAVFAGSGGGVLDQPVTGEILNFRHEAEGFTRNVDCSVDMVSGWL
jgi:hypothetical protein